MRHYHNICWYHCSRPSPISALHFHHLLGTEFHHSRHSCSLPPFPASSSSSSSFTSKFVPTALLLLSGLVRDRSVAASVFLFFIFLALSLGPYVLFRLIFVWTLSFWKIPKWRLKEVCAAKHEVVCHWHCFVLVFSPSSVRVQCLSKLRRTNIGPFSPCNIKLVNEACILERLKIGLKYYPAPSYTFHSRYEAVLAGSQTL